MPPDAHKMKRSLIKENIDRWEKGFAALSKFHAREGHSCPSRYYLEGNFNLGPWVATQRYNKRHLSDDRKRRLDAVGFVWSCPELLWEHGFKLLLKFKRRKGHCRVPSFHRDENFNLGYWVSTQRRNRNKMSTKRKARLNQIGFLWDAYAVRTQTG